LFSHYFYDQKFLSTSLFVCFLFDHVIERRYKHECIEIKPGMKLYVFF
jgi:hypothetical protein